MGDERQRNMDLLMLKLETIDGKLERLLSLLEPVEPAPAPAAVPGQIVVTSELNEIMQRKINGGRS